MIAYLSGAMEYANDEGESWRTNITEWLSKNLNHSVINPVKESRVFIDKKDAHNYRDWKENDRARYKDFIKQFVIRDIEAVTREANYIICLWNEDVFKGAGTHGEVTLAFEHNIPVFLVNQVPIKDLSGWIIGCSTEIFEDFHKLKSYLFKKFS